MIKSYEKLTYAMFHEFGNRKEPGKISLLVDLRKKPGIYAVPRDIEHIDFVKELTGTDDGEEIKEQARLLIPTHIFLQPTGPNFQYQITRYLSGISGLEIAFGVRHSKMSIDRAHEETKKFAQKGEFLSADKLQEDKKIYRYTFD